MFIFWRLILAHFIADFPLQIDRIFHLKVKHTWGSFLHSGVFILVSSLVLWPYWHIAAFWYFLLFLFLAHGFQDLLKIIFTRHLNHDNLWLFLFDQFLHFCFIAVVLLLPFSALHYNPGPGPLFYLYAKDKVIIYLIALVATGYGGAILIPYVEKLVKHQTQVEIPPKYKYQGVIERILVVALIAVPGYFFVLVPGVFFIRYFSRENYSRTAVIVSILSAVTVGLVLRFFV